MPMNGRTVGLRINVISYVHRFGSGKFFVLLDQSSRITIRGVTAKKTQLLKHAKWAFVNFAP